MPSVFVGADPPAGRRFDWVVEPSARVGFEHAAAVPDIAIVKGLLDEAVPVVDTITDGRDWSLLRDEVFQLVLTVARVEATARSLPDDVSTVVGTRHLPRPSRPARLAEGLARFTGGSLDWVGPRRPRRFPASFVSASRALRWTGGSGWSDSPEVVLAVGGPSERRALEPVAELLPAARMVDYGLVPDSSLPRLGSFLTRSDAVRSVGGRAFAANAIQAWRSHDWWGSRWAPWADGALRVMGAITLREAVLFRRATERALEGVRLLVTAKVRFARSRAIVAAATDRGVPTLATQHGIYVDGNEWTDLRAETFAVSGAAFADVLVKRGYRGDVVTAGAPFFRVPTATWDCGIALQPPEGVVLASNEDYRRHARAAYEAARGVFGPDATIGFRLHPREDEEALRRIIEDDSVLFSRDPQAGGGVWLAIESSFVVEAVLSGAPTVIMNLNDHPWEYPFAEMSGIRVAHDAESLVAQLESARTAEGDSSHVVEWRRRFAVDHGAAAAASIVDLIRARVN